MEHMSSDSPAQAVSDDVLLCVFKTLAVFTSSEIAHKTATSRFIWFRTTLPLVCKTWHRLVLETPACGHVWTSLIVDPAAEANHVKRSSRQDLVTSSRTDGGSGCSTPARGASPLLGSSPESDSGGYWTSHYAPFSGAPTGLPGGSPPANMVRQQLARLSLHRHHHHHHHRGQLHACAVISWLQQHPAAAAGVARLTLDLTHHSNHDFDRQQLEQLLQSLPKLQAVHLIGVVDGTDAYEPLGRIRQLRELDLSSASQACLDGGLMALGFLPALSQLAVCLDIHPASPCCLHDLPTGLASLQLGGMWLEQLPPQIAELSGLTSVVLDRCQLEQNPLPLLLTLPQLTSLTIRNASRSASEHCLPRLLPMTRPQQQLHLLQQLAASGGPCRARSRGSRGLAAAGLGRTGALRELGGLVGQRQGSAAAAGAGDATSGEAASSSSNGPAADARLFSNTSITSLALVSVGMQQLPSCVSQLVALQDLNLSLNHDMGLKPASCLPEELTRLTRLRGLCLGHCGLSWLPGVVALLTGLTRLELQGNALSVSGFSSGVHPADVGFRHSLRVLDLGGQGSTRGRMRGIPAWVGSCCALRELRLGCHCLGHGGSGMTRSDAISMSASPATDNGGVSATDNGIIGAGGGGAAANASPVAANGSCSYSPGGGSSSFARASANLASSGSMGGSSVSSEGLSLQQLPQLLPQLEVLYVEGGMWEHRAVREAIHLVRQLERQGSKLQVVLPL